MSSRRNVLFAIVLAAAAVVLGGCWLAIVSGPVMVSAGQTVIYVVEFSGDDGNSSSPELVAEVPLGWQLQSVTYQGSAGGQGFTGEGVVVQSQACENVLGDLPTGFRRWHLRAGEPVSGAGSGSATLEFFVDTQPAGGFDLRFLFAGGGGGSAGACGSPVAMTINPQGRQFLTLLQTLFDDSPEAQGLAGPTEAAVSPDGRHLYVAAEADQAVAVFSRDGLSGELTFVEAVIEGAGGVEGLGRHLAVSPDGRHLYAGGAGFSRDATSGELTFIERFSIFFDNLVVSPDGLHVYLSRPSGIEIFSRNAASGELTFLDTLPQESVGGLATLSPDGRHLYVVNSVDISTYSRNATTGALTLLEMLFNNGFAETAVVSPDGAHFYSATGQTVALFERDPATGHLDFSQNQGNVIAESVAVSPDGTLVVAGGRAGAHVYQRHSTSGELTFVESRFTGGLPVDGLEGTAALAFAPGSRHLYALSPSDDALLAFETATIFVDGFESGDTTAWSSTVP